MRVHALLLIVVGCRCVQWKAINDLKETFDVYLEAAVNTISSIENTLNTSKLDSETFLNSTFSNNPILERVADMRMSDDKCFARFIDEEKAKLSFQHQIDLLQTPLLFRIVDIKERLNKINSSIFIYQWLAEKKIKSCRSLTEDCLEKTNEWLKSTITTLSCTIYLNCDIRSLGKIPYCPAGQFECKYGQCITSNLFCDGVCDCGKCNDEPEHCVRDCSGFRCSSNFRCISNSKKCNNIDDCGDGTDEEGCRYSTNNKELYQHKYCSIESGNFLCRNYKCINQEQVCDGYNDCGDWSDEGERCYDQMCSVQCRKKGGVCFTGPKGFECLQGCPLVANGTSEGCSQKSENPFKTLAQVLEDTPRLTTRYSASVTQLKTITVKTLSKSLEDVLNCKKQKYTSFFKPIDFLKTEVIKMSDSSSFMNRRVRIKQHETREEKTIRRRDETILQIFQSPEEKKKEKVDDSFMEEMSKAKTITTNKTTSTSSKSTTINTRKIPMDTHTSTSPSSIKNTTTTTNTESIKNTKGALNTDTPTFRTSNTRNSGNTDSKKLPNNRESKGIVNDELILGMLSSESENDKNPPRTTPDNTKMNSSTAGNETKEKEKLKVNHRREWNETTIITFKVPKRAQERKTVIYDTFTGGKVEKGTNIKEISKTSPTTKKTPSITDTTTSSNSTEAKKILPTNETSKISGILGRELGNERNTGRVAPNNIKIRTTRTFITFGTWRVRNENNETREEIISWRDKSISKLNIFQHPKPEQDREILKDDAFMPGRNEKSNKTREASKTTYSSTEKTIPIKKELKKIPAFTVTIKIPLNTRTLKSITRITNSITTKNSKIKQNPMNKATKGIVNDDFISWRLGHEPVNDKYPERVIPNNTKIGTSNTLRTLIARNEQKEKTIFRTVITLNKFELKSTKPITTFKSAEPTKNFTFAVTSKIPTNTKTRNTSINTHSSTSPTSVKNTSTIMNTETKKILMNKASRTDRNAERETSNNTEFGTSKTFRVSRAKNEPNKTRQEKTILRLDKTLITFNKLEPTKNEQGRKKVIDDPFKGWRNDNKIKTKRVSKKTTKISTETKTSMNTEITKNSTITKIPLNKGTTRILTKSAAKKTPSKTTYKGIANGVYMSERFNTVPGNDRNKEGRTANNSKTGISSNKKTIPVDPKSKKTLIKNGTVSTPTKKFVITTILKKSITTAKIETSIGIPKKKNGIYKKYTNLLTPLKPKKRRCKKRN